MSFMGRKPVAAYALAGGTNAEGLIASHSGIVRKIAWHSLSRFGGSFELADLVQIGMIALIDAARKFEDRGIPFASYATLRIRGAIVDAYRDAANATRTEMTKQRMLRTVRKTLTEALGREPSVAEMAEQAGLSVDAIHEIISDAQRSHTLSISEFYSEDNLSFADEALNPEEVAIHEDMRSTVAREISKLTAREQQILQMFFFEDMNLDEIGLTLGVSAARVCQIKKVAVEKLRHSLGDALADIL